MTRDAIRTAVDGHTCEIDGTRYAFQLQWAAVEKHVDPAVARYLVCVEASCERSNNDGSVRLHLFARLERQSELLSLLNDALLARLSKRTITAPHVMGVPA